MSPVRNPLSAKRTADWRDEAACRTEDPALFFPVGDSGPHLVTIEQAKAICRNCPSATPCLTWALTNSIDDGVWGGLTWRERAALRRTATRRNLSHEEVLRRREQAQRATQVRQGTSLRSIFDANTEPLPGGHLAWTGSRKIHYGGEVFTIKQVAYLVGKGRQPSGQIRSTCGISECVLADHIADTADRASLKATG